MTACNTDHIIGSGLDADTLDKMPYRRFIRTLVMNGKQAYIIADYNFWSNNQVALENWLIDNTEDGLDTQEGMTLNFANEQEELMFIMRWQG